LKTAYSVSDQKIYPAISCVVK